MADAFAFEEDIAEDELNYAANQPQSAEAANKSESDSSQPANEAEGEGEGTLQETLDRAATERIKAALANAGGNRVDAATALGVDRTTLYRLMKRLSL
jgi:DNA-binding NtrC family response regulator